MSVNFAFTAFYEVHLQHDAPFVPCRRAPSVPIVSKRKSGLARREPGHPWEEVGWTLPSRPKNRPACV